MTQAQADILQTILQRKTEEIAERSQAVSLQAMTERARELGLTNSRFANATGWPDPNHHMTARDLALLAQHTIQDHPEFYHFYSETEFTYHDIRQGNRNPLLYKPMANGPFFTCIKAATT